MRRGSRHPLSAVVLLLLTTFPHLTHNQNIGLGGINQNIGGTVQNPTINQVSPGQIFTGTGTNPYYGVNLVPFGPEAGDLMVNPSMLTAGMTIDLYMFFPYYGGLYNYTTISVNGYLGFATVLDQGPTINVGPETTDWPRQEDPAMIAPYLCKQQVPQQGNPARRAGVYYRLLLRQSLFGRETNSNLNLGGSLQQNAFFGQTASQACPGTADSYVRCDSNSDYFLDQMMIWVQEGVAGGAMFRADAAVVVTWYNTASAISGRSDIDAGQTGTYQVVWLTDSTARLSYVIINYDRLGFDAQDFRGNSRSGRCRAVFNGGNHTGTVEVDPTQPYKNTPKVLAQRSGVPHMVRGRYMFRVDDVVRPAGCSNKTGGTYPIMIYPNIVNMLGDMTVDVNACCLDRTQTYKMMIEEREVATCQVINSAIARCSLPKIYDWGTKTVYFQPDSRGANDEKAFVGYIYFVPPTLDPMRLDIGNIYEWYKNPMTNYLMPITWYPRNFTNPDILTNGNNMGVRISDDSMYGVQLGLYIVGYREFKDDEIKKFRPEYRTLARITTYSNQNNANYRWMPQEEVINTNQVQQWYLTDWERMHTLYTYRVGFFKLAPINPNDQNGTLLLPGLVSAPISLHWLWTPENQQFATLTLNQQDRDQRVEFVKEKSREMCHDWYDEDGALWNFIRDTETNTSCPCIETQALLDLGRFMPHPRCSQMFRDITCTTVIGSKNCYMSSSNIYSSYAGDGNTFHNMDTNRFMTHYGQVCCYDESGYLMQTPYQPVIKTQKEYFYNPGYPLRAYEFGTAPYMGQFEVPGLSVFHNDYMPYFLCCKFADFRCQMFYWRRPSSACQQYQPPAIGHAQGTGVFQTIDNDKFIFNQPGVFNFLYIPQSIRTPEVRIQTRLERYPNRKVDFGLLGRYISQYELVQPTNATVITGIALEATGTERVIITTRKDTRRFRYRTNIIVGNILRYFDTIRLQRFRGVLIYVNNVERGQPEIYVVLEEAQIGVKVTESYALDIDRLPNYQESMGILDIQISVSPQYGVRPDGDKTQEAQYRQLYNLPRVSGLIRPYPDQTSGSLNEGLTLNDVNSDAYRQQIINNYLVLGTGEPGTQQNQAGTLNQMMPSDNMFTTSRDDDKQFDVFPEASMRSEPIYKTAPRIIPIRPTDRSNDSPASEHLQRFTEQSEYHNLPADLQPYQSIATLSYGLQCPDDPGQVLTECGDSVACLYDYALLNSKVLGQEEQDSWNMFTTDRAMAIRQYNSCGAINIEYPEYMMKTPALSSGYLQGDVARFECYQSHWVKGDHEYKCGIVVDYNRPNEYRFEWNKGNQPWCRSRIKENYFKWLAVIFGIVGIIIVILLIFLVFWCIKQKKRQESRQYSGTAAYSNNAFQNQSYETKPPRALSVGDLSNAPRTVTMPPPRGTTATPMTMEPRGFSPAPTDIQGSQGVGVMGLNTSV
ncbi:Protein CBG04396 [Caenorhabditis briggsae]|uniref:Protein CBG04396 n=1 Tax=Caenorhabditis briggsae TaxID=6238 RepID=A8WXF8_CAEBR|nr:Protein CBG04396 [Caenorhabditis briggsae]CAP25106.2 Protein CBG04396 [Caenorhabditis briggsae]